MANITLKGIAQVIKTELEPVNTKLEAIEETLAQHTKTLDTHTKALDTLLKSRKNKLDENAVAAERFTRLELWAKRVGQKIGVKLEL